MLTDTCIFCRIIRGAVPSHTLLETTHVYAFLDINPLSASHIVIVPKFHATRLHAVPDPYLAEMLPAAKRLIAAVQQVEDGKELAYNVLQNNGSLAHQEVEHVHLHLIPKRTHAEGLGIKWPACATTPTQLARTAEGIRAALVSADAQGRE